MKQSSYRFWILISIVMISGFSQGMLLPLIAVILEQSGTSSSINGLHATGLYIGVLIASPFMEKPLRRIGYKPFIMIGGLLVLISLALFPVWQSLWFWFMLRLTIGIGDHMLHFGTQTWITSSSNKDRLGRNIAIYGLSFGLGFTIGPLLTFFAETNPALPFLLSALLSFIVWLSLFKLRNEFPDHALDHSLTSSSSLSRFGSALKIAWVAFLPPLGYGFLEASLHGNFPVYALRMGIDVNSVSLILPAFAGGSLISQLPLGILSDKIGRKKVLVAVLAGGFITFFSAGFLQSSAIGLFICLLIAGMLVGSTFSLGISYMTDLLPKHLLPAGNIMCGISFSIGSILGPFLGGIAIDWFEQSFFFLLSTMLLLILSALIYPRKSRVKDRIIMNN